MTTLKRIVAVFLAVMLVAAVCSVAVAAADVPTLKLTLSVDDFEFTVYKIASLNKADGSYSYPTGVAADVQNVVKAKQATGKLFLDALNDVYDEGDGASKFGTAYTTKVKKGTDLDITDEGIYYCVAKANTTTVQKIGNAVIVWPEYDETAETWDYKLDGNNVYEAPLDSKVASGTEFFDKYFAEDFGKTKKADYQLHGQNVGDVVNFVLEGNVVGSKEEKLTAFTFSDDMCPGLDYVAGSMHVYYGTASAIDTANCDKDFDGLEAQTTDATGTHFVISAKATTLSSDAFYTKEKVYIKYQATINNAAVVGEAGNPNTGSLKYSNNFVTDHVVGEKTRYVWTFNVDATKYNGATNQPLAGATFAIASDNKFENIIATGTSTNKGKVEFKADGDSNPYRFAPGTYYVKETDVPDGFALSTVVYTVTISDKVADYSDASSVAHVNNGDAILNYPVKLPETGGTGTLMFTIIGGVLVLAAGAMFIIIMKKRSSSK